VQLQTPAVERCTFLLGAYFDGRPAERRLSELVDGGHAEAVGRVRSQSLDQRALVDAVRRRCPTLVAYKAM